MSARSRPILQLIGAVAAAALLVTLLEALTNSLDTARFSWDFRYYIDMARRGLEPPLASPFAYRFLTPLLVRIISSGLRIPVEAGFGIVAWVAAIAQLTGVFLLARWYSRSTRGAWVAVLATAFSLYHVKFLLFDTFRPDHLAYPLILLQVYLALTGKFWPLWVVTLIGCQVREFNAIPLVAWAGANWWSARQSGDVLARTTAVRQAIISALGVGLAVLLPRLLIPVAEDFQFASLTRDGLLRVLLAPLIPARDANYIYSLVAYSLPLLMLATPRQLLAVMAESRRSDQLFLATYCALVLVFSFLGGTDFYRFSSYLLPVMVLALAKLADRCTAAQLIVMLTAVFVFNRIWLPFPQTDLGRYLDFYGASGTHFTSASALRIVELAILLALGLLMRRTGSAMGDATARSLR